MTSAAAARQAFWTVSEGHLQDLLRRGIPRNALRLRKKLSAKGRVLQVARRTAPCAPAGGKVLSAPLAGCCPASPCPGLSARWVRWAGGLGGDQGRRAVPNGCAAAPGCGIMLGAVRRDVARGPNARVVCAVLEPPGGWAGLSVVSEI